MSSTPEIVVYSSSVSGNMATKKQTQSIEHMFTVQKIPFKMVDVSVDSTAKDYMISKSGKRTLPQIFVNGEFKAEFEELEENNEVGELKEFLNVH